MSFVMKVKKIERTATYLWMPDSQSMNIYIGDHVVHLDKNDTEETYKFLQKYFAWWKDGSYSVSTESDGIIIPFTVSSWKIFYSPFVSTNPSV